MDEIASLKQAHQCYITMSTSLVFGEAVLVCGFTETYSTMLSLHHPHLKSVRLYRWGSLTEADSSGLFQCGSLTCIR